MTTFNNIAEASTTPATNTTIVSVGIQGSDLVSTADDAFRMTWALLAKFYDDFGGVNTVGGTGNAITITTTTTYTALATGMRFAFIASAANTTAVTLNLDAIGAKAVRKIIGGTDVALVSGDILSGVRYELIYSATANAAAGAWIMLGQKESLLLTGAGLTPLTIQSTDATSDAGPALELYRNSASPAAADFIGYIPFTGMNSGAAQKQYAAILVRIDDATSSSEDGTLILAVMKAGTRTDYLYTGSNAAGTAAANAVGLPLGQLSFPATQNASADANTLDDYEEGTFTPTIAFGGAAVGVTYTTQTGNYTKIGNLVTGNVRVVLSAKGSSTGTLTIEGLPFTVSASYRAAGAVGNASSFTGLTGALVANLAPGGTNINIRQSSATGNANVTDTAVTATMDINVTFVFQV